MLHKNNTYPSDELYKDAKLLDMRQLFFINVAAFQYKCKYTLQKIDHTHDTRYKTNSYKTLISKKTIGQRNHRYLAPRLFNILSPEIINSKSLKIFKVKTKQFLLNSSRIDIQHLIEMK